MVWHIIRADILLFARIFPRPSWVRKNTTQLAKFPRVLYVKLYNKVYILQLYSQIGVLFRYKSIIHYRQRKSLHRTKMSIPLELNSLSVA